MKLHQMPAYSYIGKYISLTLSSTIKHCLSNYPVISYKSKFKNQTTNCPNCYSIPNSKSPSYQLHSLVFLPIWFHSIFISNKIMISLCFQYNGIIIQFIFSKQKWTYVSVLVWDELFNGIMMILLDNSIQTATKT